MPVRARSSAIADTLRLVSWLTLASTANAWSEVILNRSIRMPLAWPMMSRFTRALVTFSKCCASAAAMAAWLASSRPTCSDSSVKADVAWASRSSAPSVSRCTNSWRHSMLRTPAFGGPGAEYRPARISAQVVHPNGLLLPDGVQAWTLTGLVLKDVEVAGPRAGGRRRIAVAILADHGDRRLVGAGHHLACQLHDAVEHLLGGLLPLQAARGLGQSPGQFIQAGPRAGVLRGGLSPPTLTALSAHSPPWHGRSR